MIDNIAAVIVVLKTIILILGGLITFLAFKAYRRTKSRPLQLLAFGFGIVTVGALLAGMADQLIRLGSREAMVIESFFTLAGFGTILYSLYSR